MISAVYQRRQQEIKIWETADYIPKHLLFHIPAVQRGVVHTSDLLAQFKYFAVFFLSAS